MKIKAKYKSVSFLLATIISVSFLSPVGAYAATPVFGKKVHERCREYCGMVGSWVWCRLLVFIYSERC